MGGSRKTNAGKYGGNNRNPTKGLATATERISVATSPSNAKLLSNPSDLPELPLFMAGLEEEEYFHGLLLRDDGARMCKKDGDFILLTNESLPTSVKSLYILARSNNQEIRDVTIKMVGTKYCFDDSDGTECDTITQLIKHYHKKKLPVHSDIYLRHGIRRNDWELLHRKIELKQKLGEGAQANVQRGVFFHGSHPKKSVEVAVKIYKGNVDNEKLIEIMHEVRIMLQFDHENVVKFVGIAACRSPMYIVLELVHGGGLNRYLKIKKNDVTTMQRICMCADAANGLEYIHSLGIVHRDVASRNCLYSQSKQRTLISDFGLSQQEEFCTIDPTKPLPIRWLAPEVMSTFQCTKMSDVWSYGVLCWEIFYHCQDPYSDIKLQKDVIDQVLSGVRLNFTPENVPQQIIDIICQCWDITPTSRPTIKEISQKISPFCERPSTKNSSKKKDNNSKTKDSLRTKEFQQSRSRRAQPESGGGSSNRDSNRSHHERLRKNVKTAAIDPPSNNARKRTARNRKKRSDAPI